jgi:asparagine synthetase B (glutamine-hydrolysing)
MADTTASSTVHRPPSGVDRPHPGPRFSYERPAAPGDPFDPGVPTLDAARLTDTFSLSRLAVYFGLPAISRDLHPASAWTGVQWPRGAPPVSTGGSDPDELPDRLDDAIRRMVGDHECVAVALSGGLDSVALVERTARICRRQQRRLITVTMAVTDDLGRRPATIAARALEFLRVDAEHIVIEASPSRHPEPAWSIRGPRFDAWPRYHAAMVSACEERGAGVLLHGTGADQLLQTVPFARGDAREPGADARQPAVIRALSAGRIRTSVQARLYWASVWPGFAADRGAPVLASRWEPALMRWLADFQEEHLAPVVRGRATWAQAALMHRVFPFDRLASAGSLPELAPFQDPAFARYAYDLPMRSRFGARHPNAYLRSKALVADLLPAGVEAVLAPERQRCYQAYQQYWKAVATDAPLLVELGLVHADWRRRCRDSFDLAMVMNVEAWVGHAMAGGATPTD